MRKTPRSFLRKIYREQGQRRIVTLASLPDIAMRRAQVGALLASGRLPGCLWFLDRLVLGALRGDLNAQVVYEAILIPKTVTQGMLAGQLDALFEMAKEERALGASFWLEAACFDSSTNGNKSKSKHEVKNMKAEPLGLRRADARRAPREVLDRLLGDIDPYVVANLLNNPRIVQSDVLRICSRRPTQSDVLEQVLMHPEWGRRHAVRRAIVLNPDLMPGIACSLLVLLGAQERQDVAATRAIADTVRTSAKAIEALVRKPRLDIATPDVPE